MTMYILAANYEEAQTWAHQFLKQDDPWTYIEGVEMLEGLHQFDYVRVGTWRHRKDLESLEIALQVRLANQKVIL